MSHKAVVLAALSTAVVCLLEGCGSSKDETILVLPNGVRMPRLSAGTWLYNDTVAEQAVEAALAAGFRHIDTAYDYHNQVGVGKGLMAANLKREDVFITTKVPGCNLQGVGKENCYENTVKLIKSDINQLSSAGYPVGYIDLILLHFPPCMAAAGTEKSPLDTVCFKDRSGCTGADNCAAIAEQWRALEWALSVEYVKSVGVSNYCSACFACLKGTVKPMVNQVQWHVGMGVDPQGFASFAKKNGMVLQAWSPLGHGGNGSTDILKGDLTTSIGKAHDKSAAQVALKWLESLGAAVATKSSNPQHLKENLDIYDFSLSKEEMTKLNSASFAKDDTPSFLCDDKPAPSDMVVVT